MRHPVNRRLSSGCPLKQGEKVHVLHIENEHSFEEGGVIHHRQNHLESTRTTLV
jgi:hypothetical protein